MNQTEPAKFNSKTANQQRIRIFQMNSLEKTIHATLNQYNEVMTTYREQWINQQLELNKDDNEIDQNDSLISVIEV
jgi:hypothetical protein